MNNYFPVSSTCLGRSGMFDGTTHSFEARYDETFRDTPKIKLDGTATVKQIEALMIQSRTYVHDVCTKCGELRVRTHV